MSYKFDKAKMYYKEKRLLELSVKALKIAVELPESEFHSTYGVDAKFSCDVNDNDLIYFITDDIAVTREKIDNLGDDYITRYSVYLKEDWNALMDEDGLTFEWYLISYIENASSCSYVNFGDDALSYHKNDNYIIYSTNRADLELTYPFNKDDYFNYLMSTNLQQIPYEVLKELLDFDYPEGFHGNYFDY